MSFFKLSGLLQDFFARRQAWLVAGLLLAAGGFTANAQTSASNQRAVLLNVVAADSAGNPVPDLKTSEFAVFDNGSPGQIASVRLNQSDKPGPLVVLFDPLMDAAMQKVSQVKPVDFRAVSGISLQSCFTHRHLSRAGRYARAYGSVAWPQGTAMGHLRYSKHYSPCGSDLV